MDWLCWHVGTVSDAKFTAVARKAQVSKPVVIALWAYLLERAKTGNPQGVFGSFDAEDAAITLEIEEHQVTACLASLRQKGMINETEIVNWIKRQNKPSTERTRAFRKRQGTLRNGSEPLLDVPGTREHAQDRTGQDNKKDITTTVPVAARANGIKNGSHFNGGPKSASRPSPEFTADERHEAWAMKMVRFMRVHWSADETARAIALKYSEDVQEREQGLAIFNRADADYKSRKAAGTLQPINEV